MVWDDYAFSVSIGQQPFPSPIAMVKLDRKQAWADSNTREAQDKQSP